MPGYKEIMEIINNLVEVGIISKDSQGKIIPSRSLDEIPMLGLVEAGLPSSVDEEMTDTISIDNYLIENKDSSYMLEVKGESMIDAGIHEGDLVIVERKGVPKVGDIVIAEVDGGWTMKYFRKKGDQVYLEPANKKFKNIYPTQELRVAAIVKGVVRKY